MDDASPLLDALAGVLRDTGARIEETAAAAIGAGATAPALQDFDRLAQRCAAAAAVLEAAARRAGPETLLAAARIEDLRIPVAAALGVAIDASGGEDAELF